jgi:hypothetical protein
MKESYRVLRGTGLVFTFMTSRARLVSLKDQKRPIAPKLLAVRIKVRTLDFPAEFSVTEGKYLNLV